MPSRLLSTGNFSSCRLHCIHQTIAVVFVTRNWVLISQFVECKPLTNLSKLGSSILTLEKISLFYKIGIIWSLTLKITRMLFIWWLKPTTLYIEKTKSNSSTWLKKIQKSKIIRKLKKQHLQSLFWGLLDLS